VRDAAAYGPLVSAKLFIAVVLGGAVAPAGGLVGVAVLALLGRLVELGGLEGQQAARLETLLVALIVVAAVGAVERGLLPSFSDWRRQRRTRQVAPATSSRSRPREVDSPVAVEARGLTKRFDAVVALEDVNLDVPPATVHALIGPNGSGKTTALRILAGWLEPDAGTVTVVGGRRDDVVGTLQATSLFPELTVLENALVGAHRGARHRGVGRTLLATPQAREEARAAEGRAQRALETVGLGDVADVLAHELPGNAQRRLMIAAALAAEPRVLLLDEPSAGADREEVDVLADLVGDLRESGFTVVLVEHNLRLVRRVADRVTVLAAGRTIAEGSVAQVAEDEAVLSAYLGGHRF
jgi:ABC-type branched-subunit amino acid transport system ATPase component